MYEIERAVGMSPMAVSGTTWGRLQAHWSRETRETRLESNLTRIKNTVLVATVSSLI